MAEGGVQGGSPRGSVQRKPRDRLPPHFRLKQYYEFTILRFPRFSFVQSVRHVQPGVLRVFGVLGWLKGLCLISDIRLFASGLLIASSRAFFAGLCSFMWQLCLQTQNVHSQFISVVSP
jgi:hypothetical protein